MKKNYLYVIIGALVLFNIFIIGNIKRETDYNIQRINMEQDRIRREIGDIYSNVDEMLKKQASVIDSYEVAFGEDLNTESFTVPVSISVTPKENTQKLTAELLINDERYPMSKNGAAFSASINAHIFEPFKIIVVLNDDGTEKVETLDEYNDLQYKYILDFYAGFSGSSSYGSGKYKYDGDIMLDFIPDDNSLGKVKILRYINGELDDEQEVDMQDKDSANHSVKSVKDEAELSANDRIEIYVSVQDKYGFNYKYIVLADEIDSEGKLVTMRPEWTNGSLAEITDKNGKVVFEEVYK